MELNILKKLELIDNDTYLIHSVLNKLIINDNYKGIIILNEQLNKLNKIPLIQDLCIERIYNQFSSLFIFIYSFENNCFIHLNVETFEWFKINIENPNMLFSPVYWWENPDELILSTYQKKLYSLNKTTGILKEISNSYIHKKYKFFNNFWKFYQDKILINFFPQDGIGLCTYDEKIILYFDFINNVHKKIPLTYPQSHEIIYKNGIYSFISEKEINVISKDSEKKIMTKKPYIFTHAQFLSNQKMVTLQNNQSVSNKNIISIYEVCLN